MKLFSTLGTCLVSITFLASCSLDLDQRRLEYINWSNREPPTWFENAKLGIFIHWGLYSVPAYAATDDVVNAGLPVGDNIMTIITNGGSVESSYAEWYKNNMEQPFSKTLKYHNQTFGEDFDYYEFAPEFNQASKNWDPSEWADTFKQAGAKYVVLTTKHHDSFTLWPSAIPNPYIPNGNHASARDLTGDLTTAVREKGLKMGLYYSSGLDWARDPDVSMYDVIFHIVGLEFPWNADKNIFSNEYSDVVDSHWQELLEQYEPDVLWSDIGAPEQGKLQAIVDDYLQEHPDAVVNDRWMPSGVKADFMTPEYVVKDEIVPYKWETCRGMGSSFGFNQFEDEKNTLSSEELIHMFVDIVSKNGNLLLNVGPKADGSIPAIQLDRLQKLGRWMSVNGEGIYGSRPWSRAVGETLDGQTLRFTKKGDDLYVFVLDQPKNSTITLVDVAVSETQAARLNIELLGEPEPLSWRVANNNLVIDLPELTQSEAYTFRLSGYEH